MSTRPPSRSIAASLASARARARRWWPCRPSSRATQATPWAMLPGAGGEQPPGAQLRRRRADRVAGAADLERVDGLERLELEVDLGGRAVEVQADERRAHREVGHPLAGGADLVQGDHSSTSVPRPCRRATLTATCAAARSSTPMPSERNSVSSSSLSRPGWLPRHHLPQLGADVILARDQPLLHGQPELAGLVAHRLAAVAEQGGGGHRRGLDLPGGGRAGADGVDVRAGREPRVLEHRALGAGGDDDHVGALARPPGPSRRPRGLRGRRAAPRRGRSVGRVDADLVPRAHTGERDEMRARLDPGAEHAEHAGAVAGQRASGHRGDRGGADLGDRRGVEDRRRHARVAVVERHRALVGVQAPRRVAAHDADHLEPEGRALGRRPPPRRTQRRPPRRRRA